MTRRRKAVITVEYAMLLLLIIGVGAALVGLKSTITNHINNTSAMLENTSTTNNSSNNTSSDIAGNLITSNQEPQTEQTNLYYLDTTSQTNGDGTIDNPYNNITTILSKAGTTQTTITQLDTNEITLNDDDTIGENITFTNTPTLSLSNNNTINGNNTYTISNINITNGATITNANITTITDSSKYANTKITNSTIQEYTLENDSTLELHTTTLETLNYHTKTYTWNYPTYLSDNTTVNTLALNGGEMCVGSNLNIITSSPISNNMLVKNRGAMANYGWKTTIIVLNSCDYVFTSEDMANIEWEIDSYSAAVSDITSESNFIMRFNLTDSAISFTYRAMFGTPEPDSEIILF